MCPLKKNSTFANDHHEKINSYSMDTSQELKNAYCEKEYLIFYDRNWKKFSIQKIDFFAKILLLQSHPDISFA